MGTITITEECIRPTGPPTDKSPGIMHLYPGGHPVYPGRKALCGWVKKHPMQNPHDLEAEELGMQRCVVCYSLDGK